LHFADQIYSFEEAAEWANGAAEQLADLGVDRGQVVASVLPNSPQAVFLWFGLMQLGALHLPLNPRAPAPELAGTLRHAEPVLLVGTSEADDTLAQAGAQLSSPPRLVTVDDVTMARSPKGVRRPRATQFNVIGAMIEMFLQTPPTDDDSRHDARICFGGPTPPRDRHLEFEHRFGVTLTSGYALSESPYGMIWPRDEPPPYGSV